MALYAKAVKRRERLDGSYLREFDRALDWAHVGRERGATESIGDRTTEGGGPTTTIPAEAGATDRER